MAEPPKVSSDRDGEGRKRGQPRAATVGHRLPPPGCWRWSGSRWVLVFLPLRAIGSWRRSWCHAVKVDDFKPQAG